MAGPWVAKVALELAPWQQLQPLLDTYYPRPPRDVFQRVVAACHRRQRLWLASDGDGLLGLVMLSPHSKGGHLDNLAVAPSARGRGIGQQLVQTLLQAVGHEGLAMVTLTTRIPSFFSPFGFQPCCPTLPFLSPPPHDDRDRRSAHRRRPSPVCDRRDER